MLRNLLLIGFSLCSLVFSVDRPTSPLAHWVSGEGNPETIILIHGFNDSHETWDKIVPQLAKRYKVITYDQPGHGDSPAEGKDFTPQYMAEQLKTLMDSLNIKSAHIVGHSMGGRTAMEFAAKYPEKTKSILVEDMSAMTVADSVQKLPAALANFDAVKKNIPNTFSGYLEADWKLSKYFSFEDRLFILAAMKKLPDGRIKLGNRPEVTQLYLHQGLAQDMSKQLKAITSPFMFFAADPDTGLAMLTPEGIDHIHSVRPDVKVKVFPDATHTIHGERDYTEALLQFIENRQAIPHKVPSNETSHK